MFMDLTRRGVISGLLAAVSVRRMDQRQLSQRRGLPPPPPSNVVIGRFVVVAGSAGGIFVYSPTAGAGNLVASITAAAGLDPYGNLFLAGITDYSNVGGTFVSAQLQGGTVAFATAAAAGGPYTGSATIGNIGAGPSVVADLMINSLGSYINLAGTQTLISVSSATPVTAARLEVQGGAAQQVARLITDAAATIGLGIAVSGDTNPRLNATGAGNLNWGSGSAAADVSLLRPSANLLRVGTADLQVHAIGRGLQVAEGANAKQGTATLAAGTILVANTSVTASSRIFPAAQDNNTTGALRISAKVVGTSFTITSSNAADTGVVAYEIFEPG